MVRPSDDGREKRGVSSGGRNIGRVRGVDNDRATVERSDDDGSSPDGIKHLPGWSGDDEAYELGQTQVDRHDDTEIHLRSRR